ncbi:hypothetical protein N0V83_003004 [Neocucurbitaria cava]|uniref:Uncharacterized protein n=1 Tax=Neocucurbitaria cava TaxID=798079 RepID=A0A9W8YDS2_9PLEO|nr:hypothetical protein N0V83_003004 [Neocucurbitaria cava]
MTELKANLSSYDLETALNADLADKRNGCFVLDVHDGANVGERVTSLKIVLETVDDYLLNCHDLLAPITKLYIVGIWTPEILATADKPSTEDEDEDASDAGQEPASEEQEYRLAAAQIAKLIEQMPALKELTWISGLPLLACVLEKLPKSMTKIILNLGQGICVQQDTEYSHMAYITPTDMKPLLEQTELKELRLFSMQVSLQCVVWETVFRNKAEGGMFLLDLGMATAPLVRKNHWLLAQDVVGLKVVNEDSKDKGYKGVDGKGILHYSFGTGEYLDDFCMRKARIASGSDDVKPLPLKCLKLDGFVIDNLPFDHELSSLVLLTCGDDCIDAGLRAPKTTEVAHSNWGEAAANGLAHCRIQFPRWTGFFDGEGNVVA